RSVAMRNWEFLPSLVFYILLSGCLAAQEQNEDTVENIQDNIQIDVKSVSTEEHSDTRSIELFLISYQMDPREFKLITYATEVIDSAGNNHLVANIQMGRVQVRLTDRQNYIHYLLEEDVPIPLTIEVGNWKGKKASKVLLVFEDSTEEGKFITQEVDL